MSMRQFLMLALAAFTLSNLTASWLFGQQTLPSPVPKVPPLRPDMVQRIPPEDYQMMKAIFQQMLEQAADSSPKPMPPQRPANQLPIPRTPERGTVPMNPVYPLSCPMGACPACSPASVPPQAVDRSQTAPPKADLPILGTWQRKTDLLSCILQIKPDHLSLEMDIRNPNLEPIKIYVLAEYIILKDQRTILCYITNIDIISDKSIRQDGLKAWKEIGNIQQAFVETAVVAKVALYQDAFVISSLRLAGMDNTEIVSFLHHMICGRYERVELTKTVPANR
ncbi:MAG: hypothetical protein WHU94_04115 [Thermogemmata sp.]|nr:hypothetical protein [Gemmataceae bacterium]